MLVSLIAAKWFWGQGGRELKVRASKVVELKELVSW